MPRIEWGTSFSVNNDEIDAQHKTWIRTLNTLHDSMISDEDEDTIEVITASLEAMISYTRFHFKFEEEYMRKINYPNLSDHLKLHENFIARLCEYDNDMRNGDLVLGTRIIKTMQEWLIEHILTEDKKYALFISQGGD
jgi:hemerythrin